MKKTLGETQTLRASRKRGTKDFRPTTDSFPGVQDRQNLISWGWSLPAYTNPIW